MLSVYVACWIFLQTFQTYFCIQANSVDPDQTAPKGEILPSAKCLVLSDLSYAHWSWFCHHNSRLKRFHIIFFLFLHEKICCGYPLEQSQLFEKKEEKYFKMLSAENFNRSAKHCLVTPTVVVRAGSLITWYQRPCAGKFCIKSWEDCCHNHSLTLTEICITYYDKYFFFLFKPSMVIYYVCFWCILNT